MPIQFVALVVLAYGLLLLSYVSIGKKNRKVQVIIVLLGFLVSFIVSLVYTIKYLNNLF